MNSNLSHGHMQSCNTRVNLRKGSTYIPLLHSEHTPVPLLCLFTWSIIKGNIFYVFNYGGPVRYNYFLFFIPQLPQDMYFMIKFMLWWAGALATLTEDTGLIPSINITAPSRLKLQSHVMWGFCRHYTHVIHRHRCRQDIHIHKIIKKYISTFRN